MNLKLPVDGPQYFLINLEHTSEQHAINFLGAKRTKRKNIKLRALLLISYEWLMHYLIV